VRAALYSSLLEGADEGDPGWLLAHLLYYHRREAKAPYCETAVRTGEALARDEAIELAVSITAD
jgi:hypothetical protein